MFVMKRNILLVALLLASLCMPVSAQNPARFSSTYKRPATNDGFFYVQRHRGIIMDAEDGFDPRALVLSYDNKPLADASKIPDAPTVPGFYLTYAAPFGFERVQVVGSKVYFRTRTIAGVYYRFSGVIGSQRSPDASKLLSYIKGVLTRVNNGRVMSQEEIKFVRA
jgi:hypothetical protein